MMDFMLNFLVDIKFPPELYALAVSFLLCRYMHNKIKEHPETLGKKWEYFLASTISKKFLAVIIVIIFYWYDHFVWQYDGIRFWEFVLALGALLGLKELSKLAEALKR